LRIKGTPEHLIITLILQENVIRTLECNISYQSTAWKDLKLTDIMIDIMLIVDRTALLALSKASARVSTSVSSNESASTTVPVEIKL